MLFTFYTGYLFLISKSIYCAGFETQLRNFLKGKINNCSKSRIRDNPIGEKYTPAIAAKKVEISPDEIHATMPIIKPNIYKMKIMPSIKNSSINVFKNDKKGQSPVILEILIPPLSL